nr:unnamed protein product [Digitaria exilis]
MLAARSEGSAWRRHGTLAQAPRAVLELYSREKIEDVPGRRWNPSTARTLLRLLRGTELAAEPSQEVSSRGETWGVVDVV